MTDFDDRTPTRPKMPSVTSETSTNGDHDPRAEAHRQPRGETQAEKLERLILECHGLIGEVAREVALARSAQDRMGIEHASMSMYVDSLAHEQKRIASALEGLHVNFNDVARSINARRTVSSGSLKLSIPPSLKAQRSNTGSHFEVDPEEVRRYEERFADAASAVENLEKQLAELQAGKREADAERRGAEALLEQQRRQQSEKDVADGRRARKISLIVSIAVPVAGAILTAIGYLTGIAHHL